MKVSENEILIQRLIDDELDEVQRAEFIQLAESSPELWRETALGFIEDRIWSGVIVRQPAGHRDVNHGVGTREAKQRQRGSWWTRNGPRLMVTAASVMLVLSLALRFNPVETPEAPGNRAAEPGAIPFAHQDERDDSTKLVNHPYRLQVNPNFDVPIYQNQQEFFQEMERLTRVDPQMIAEFENAGLQIVPDIRYIQGNSRDGSFIVPIQRFQIRRIGQ